MRLNKRKFTVLKSSLAVSVQMLAFFKVFNEKSDKQKLPELLFKSKLNPFSSINFLFSTLKFLQII
jgi:hypothetical protein